MFRIFKNMKRNQKLGIGGLVLICIIIFVSLSLQKTANIGSAAKDPNACQIGNLMISLDKDIWDTDRFQVVRDCESQGIFRSADSAVVRLKYELEDTELLGNPCIQFIYYQFEDYTYEEYIADSDSFLEKSNIESCRKDIAQYEGHDAFICEYTIKDGNTHYCVAIGKGSCVYGITYNSCESMYDDYFDEFLKSLNSIHIKHF